MLDLRDLMNKIQEQKQMNANLSLEFDCVVETEDPTPLIKVINYIINYLAPLTNKALEISLNFCFLKFIILFFAFNRLIIPRLIFPSYVKVD